MGGTIFRDVYSTLDKSLLECGIFLILEHEDFFRVKKPGRLSDPYRKNRLQADYLGSYTMRDLRTDKFLLVSSSGVNN